MLLLIVCAATAVRAQKIDSIFFNLYTDSLKKGALHFNYINVDGKMSNGSYLPLDTTRIRFTCSVGRMVGNVLQLDSSEQAGFVIVTATLIENPAIFRQVKIYVKKLNESPQLKTQDELIEGWQKKRKQ